MAGEIPDMQIADCMCTCVTNCRGDVTRNTEYKILNTRYMEIACVEIIVGDTAGNTCCSLFARWKNLAKV